MIEFFRSLFKPERSSTTAKERLRLVLLSDHLSLAPEVIEALKADLFAVISRYLEIDAGNADVTFEHRDHDVAMLASVPIRQLRLDRPLPPPLAREPEPVAAVASEAVETASRLPDATAEVLPQPKSATAPRRRRRRKPAQAPQVSQPQVS